MVRHFVRLHTSLIHSAHGHKGAHPHQKRLRYGNDTARKLHAAGFDWQSAGNTLNRKGSGGRGAAPADVGPRPRLNLQIGPDRTGAESGVEPGPCTDPAIAAATRTAAAGAGNQLPREPAWPS